MPESKPISFGEELRERIYNALTSDYAETLHTEDWRKHDRLSWRRYLKREIFLKWDGLIPNSLAEKPDFPTHFKTLTAHQLAINVEGFSAGLEDLIDLEDGEHNPPLAWPDRMALIYVNRNNHEFTRVQFMIENPQENSVSTDALQSWVFVYGTNHEDNLELATFGLTEVTPFTPVLSKTLTRRRPLFGDLQLINSILKYGSLDMESAQRSAALQVRRYGAMVIQNPNTLRIIAPYFSALTNHLLTGVDQIVSIAR